jgi:hypothetical protein
MAGCRSESPRSAPDGSPSRLADLPPAHGDDEAHRGRSTISPVLPLVGELQRSEIIHRGVLIDLGSPGSHGMTGTWVFGADPSFAETEHDGATWARILGRNVTLHFVQDQPAPLFVSLRARGSVSRSVAVLLDGRPIGTLPLARAQIRIVSTHATSGPVAAGVHSLVLRFSGATRAQSDPLAELDWVRLGEVEEDVTTYAPPTLRELVTDAALGGVPHRSIALRAPSTVRLTTFIAREAHLETAVGFEGVGEADLEISIGRDGEPKATLRSLHVTGGERAKWASLDLPLDSFAGKIATIELAAKTGTAGGRVLFGDPVIAVRREAAPAAPAARLAVVVALAGVDRSRLSSPSYPTLSELERTLTSFELHRAPTTVTAGVMATLITGLSPRAHALEDPGARLSDSLTTIAVAARDGSVQTAMFTGCPTTFEAFGFARGWDKYASYSPVGGAAAVAPITDATLWLADHTKLPDARALVVIHARGGHPPWDVTPLEASKLPPLDYSGSMEPRRSAEVIARARVKHSRFRLTENDRVRMWAIYEQAVAGQDRALGGLIDSLRRSGLWDKSLFVVTGDVALGADGHPPFGEAEELAESELHLPLWVHFPGAELGGSKVATPTEVPDVARAVLDALKLTVPDGFEGHDLFAIAAGAAFPRGRPLWATLGPAYSTRWGDLVLMGASGRVPFLCDLSVDPSCDADRLEKMPRTARALFRAAYDAEAAASKMRRHAREPATIDADTAAALQVWGQ